MDIRFVLYGLFGWCAETVWTAAYDFFSKSQRAPGVVAGRIPLVGAERWRLSGRTYLWMFLVYGIGGLLFERMQSSMSQFAWSAPGSWAGAWIVRGLMWTMAIYALEGAAGIALRKITGSCPWDYSYAKWHVAGVIRLDYIPVWFFLAILFERFHALFVAIEPAIRTWP